MGAYVVFARTAKAAFAFAVGSAALGQRLASICVIARTPRQTGPNSEQD
jgi:hypothetical protein